MKSWLAGVWRRGGKQTITFAILGMTLHIKGRYTKYNGEILFLI